MTFLSGDDESPGPTPCETPVARHLLPDSTAVTAAGRLEVADIDVVALAAQVFESSAKSSKHQPIRSLL